MSLTANLPNGGLDELWRVFDGLTGSSVNLFDQGVELTGNVGGVTIQDWRVTGRDLTWVVQDDNLSVERVRTLGWVVLGVRGNVTSSDFLDGNVLDVETNVVTWDTFS
ncbi:hypothetical protein WICPIJ_001891 [Wickerhamomyces pijperi]|uniref:Uncharacterized protein n=1 Tax=Wickerhamomyces pijperi TaxID=599730 RepID=A0A9P8TQ61_WICPI|nr:hypothetical protein WICPIJ_001891 [Wickerhamomyces pijperi]